MKKKFLWNLRPKRLYVSGTFWLLSIVFCLFSCTSGSQFDERNHEIFTEAQKLATPTFTATPLDFDGNISALVTEINGLGDYAEVVCTTCEITGVVTMPSNYGVALGSTDTGCATSDKIYSRSFVLQDKNAAILVAYGLEPPSQNTADSNSATYINNARNSGLAALGHKITFTATKIQKYGDATNSMPVVTDFNPSTVKVLSTDNSIPYKVLSAAQSFSRGDIYQVRQLEGYVTQRPSYVECPSASNTRQFQYNYQKGYIGKICVGASSYVDAQTCTGGKKEYNFQLSLYLGAGTLSGFDTGDMFSYNIAKGAKVRMTGPVYVPQFKDGDSALNLMLGQRLQVETLH